MQIKKFLFLKSKRFNAFIACLLFFAFQESALSKPGEFSNPPKDHEFFHVHIFQEALVPGSGVKLENEDRDLARVIKSYHERGERENISEFETFLKKYPNSRWQISVLVNLGLKYYYGGHYSKALASFETVWKIGKNETGPQIHEIVSRGFAELTELNARLGRKEQLESLINESEGRVFPPSVCERISRAKEGLWRMENLPGEAFLCGPFALYRIRSALQADPVLHSNISDARSTPNGTSLKFVKNLASSMGMDYQMAKRHSGAEVIVPSVIHWKLGHYAAIVKEEDGYFRVEDPTFVRSVLVNQETIDEESSGYFLVPPGKLPRGWQKINDEEGETVWGKGDGGTGSSDETGPDAASTGCPRNGSGKLPAAPPPSSGSGSAKKGMAAFNMQAMIMGLTIFDTPLAYTPPRGSPIVFTLTYSQREAHQSSSMNFCNLGQPWTFDWFSYLEKASTNLTADAFIYGRGGGWQTYIGYNTNTSRYITHRQTHAILEQVSPSNFVRILPNGWREVFDKSDGSKIFMTKMMDSASNTVAIAYDDYYRITNVLDAIGQSTRIDYSSTNVADTILFYRPKTITDPFSRSSTILYTTNVFSGSSTNIQVSGIIDVQGMTSAVVYATSERISSLTTPYGTTAFAAGDSGSTNRWIEITHPNGEKERAEFQGYQIAQLPYSEDATPDGTKISIANYYINARNTFYWNKKAMAEGAGDYTKAHVFHWAHAAGGVAVSGVLESEKSPLERRVWYNYPNQVLPNSDNGVTNTSPSKIGRLLDDNTTQLYKFDYNNHGNVTKFTDPNNRITVYNYETNLFDLLQVGQVVGTSTQMLVTVAYNSLHLPVQIVDSSSTTNTFGYDGNGLLTGVTNSLGEAVQYARDSFGYITNISGPLSASVGFTYTNGTVRTMTDSDGYTVILDRDNLDRVIKVTFPDGSTEEMTYDKLDVTKVKDRLGRITRMFYNSVQQMTGVQDPYGRMVNYIWCGCGSLEAIIDPMGNKTTFMRDLQSRLTSKVYPDGSTENYTFENSTSRLQKFTDVKGQETFMTYSVDNNLSVISNSVAATTPVVKWEYDSAYNRPTKMIDGIGTNTYSYVGIGTNGAGGILSIDGPYSSDITTYLYDALGRVKRKDVDWLFESYTYDSLGRATTVSNYMGIFTYSYDGSSSRLKTLAYPYGQTNQYAYYGTSGDLRLSAITNLHPSGSILSIFKYDYNADGTISRWTQQTNSATPIYFDYTYDKAGQLTYAVRKNSATGAVLTEYSYGYDKAGNQTRNTSHGAWINTSVNNNLNQTISQIGTNGGPFYFEGDVNEMSTVTVGGTNAVVTSNLVFSATVNLQPGSNQISVVARDYGAAGGNVTTSNYVVWVTNDTQNTRMLGYDANGNCTYISNSAGNIKTTFTWDGYDRLLVASNGNDFVSFNYDGMGRYSRKIVMESGTATTNVYHWTGNQIFDRRNFDGSSINKAYFAHGESSAVGHRYFTRDHLGSVRESTHLSGDFIGDEAGLFDYSPYGERFQYAGSGMPERTFTGHFRFEFGNSDQMLMTRYRAYHPYHGKWLSRDPIAEDGGLNLYGYVNNDPINNWDPLGLSHWSNPDGSLASGFGINTSINLEYHPDQYNGRAASFDTNGDGMLTIDETEYGLEGGNQGLQSDPLGEALIGAAISKFALGAIPSTFKPCPTGGMKQWFRFGESFSKNLDEDVSISFRWGASPKHAYKIENPTFRQWNQSLREMKIPVDSWRTADPGHFHIIK